MGIRNIYYGIWSGMKEWPIVGRAAIVICILLLVIYIFFPFIKKMIGVAIKGSKCIVTLAFIGILCIVELISRKDTQVIRAERCNKISDKAYKVCNQLQLFSESVATGKRASFGIFIVIYIVCLVLIGLPDMVKNFVNEEYLPAFSFVANGYQTLERKTLETASTYPPLFKDVKKEEQEEDSNVNEENESGEEADKEIWLTLSEKGKNGANIRELPTKDSKAIMAIAGEEKVLYLNDQEDGWVYVQLEDGKNGWIRDYLLNDVP